MTALAVMAGCTGVWVLTHAIVDEGQSIRLERAVDVDALWFAAADALLLERQTTGYLLLADSPASPNENANLAAVRGSADRAFEDLETFILSLSPPGAEGQLQILRGILQDLSDNRQWTDDLLARSRSERGLPAFTRYFSAVMALVDRLDAGLDLGDVAAAQRDGLTVELIAVSRQVWSVRRLEAARVAPVIGALAFQETLSPLQTGQQARFDGAITAGWQAIDALLRRLPGETVMTLMVTSARSAYEEFDSLSQRAVRAIEDGVPPPVSAPDLCRIGERNGQPLLAARNAALAAALARAREYQQNATAGVALSASALVLILAGTIAAVLLLRRRIVTPVLALTDAIDRLATHDYAITIPALSRNDEIGRMAAALELLRQGAIAAEKTQAQIVHMARHDALTGLANRALLDERIEQAIAWAERGRPAAVLCLDLDRFKSINDTFGHPTGDVLLRVMAKRLCACVREVDTVARLGGDEFVVLLAGLEETDHASVVANRIVQALEEPFDLGGPVVRVGASVGIAIAPQDGISAMALLKNADIALYRVKEEAPGTYRHFQPEMQSRLLARTSLEQDLREAVRDEVFDLAFQPQFSLEDNRICGFEALLRWWHPTKGVIRPDEFIPLAEETGLIIPIGAWVLRRACAEALHWPPHLTVGVNLSAVQCKTTAIVETVKRTLTESGLPAARLDLEITESALLHNSGGAVTILRGLGDLGISISMDDFGTGYSSLSYLRSFPFDRIKIDKAFVNDLAASEDARAIIRAVVALGRSLGMRTLAEGVETHEQLEQLRREGCDEVQGNLFSKPVPAREARLAAQGAARARVVS